MLSFVRKSALAAFVLALLGAAPLARAQFNSTDGVEGSLGSYYQNLYIQTHWMSAALGHYSRPGHRSVRYIHAAPVWTLSPSHAAVITRMVNNVPPSSRPQMRSLLQKALSAYPLIVRAGGKSEGVTLHANSTIDAATLAGVASYEELTGHDLTRAQFAAERESTRRLWAASNVSAEVYQHDGETYAMAVCLMAVLKDYEKNPQNKNPDATRQQLHQAALYVFQTGYKSADYTKFAPTSRGIVKVSQ